MDGHATSFRVNNRRAALLEFIANRHYCIGLISGAHGSCGKSEFTNRRLKLLARNSVRQYAQLWELCDAALIIIGVRRLIPLGGHKCTTYRSADRLMIHLRDGGRHGVVTPAAFRPPASTPNSVALNCSNHRRRRAAWSGFSVASLLTVAAPTTTTVIATITSITSITSSSSAIVARR